METIIFSIVIPVFQNEASLPSLVQLLEGLVGRVNGPLEVVFVVDASPDRSFQLLQELLPRARINSQLLLLSHNFGSFPAIAAGLDAARGDYFAVVAADLQEPPELVVEFFQSLTRGECDLVVGKRQQRQDPWLNRVFAALFWSLYCRFVQREMPKGGVDVFACNRLVRDQILALKESNSTLVGLLMWVGFRRRTISYVRAARPFGKSAWSFGRKLRYLKDSIFAFSDLPVRLLAFLGALGLLVAFGLTGLVLIEKLTGRITVPGYAASAIIIIFFGALNSLGIAMLGEYLWRTFENTKARPRFIVSYSQTFAPANEPSNATSKMARSVS